MILEGDYHFKNRSFLTSFFGKKILKIATDYDFIKTDINIDFIPPPNAIFTTKSDRNLNFLIDSWFEIRKKNPDSNLYINPPHQLTKTQIENGIILRNKDKKDLLIKELINSKLFISPGHKTEVFCLAAEEAKELCVPIVTMGIGCLYERVEHEKTGFIAKTQKEFVNYSSLILNDNKVYKSLRQNLYNIRNSRNQDLKDIETIENVNIKKKFTDESGGKIPYKESIKVKFNALEKFYFFVRRKLESKQKNRRNY